MEAVQDIIIQRLEDLPRYESRLPLREMESNAGLVALDVGDQRFVLLVPVGKLFAGEAFNARSFLEKRGLAHERSLECASELINALRASDRKALLQKDQGESKAIDLFDEVVKMSLIEKASDIHFERRDIVTQIRMRVFGDLFPMMELDNQKAEDVIRVAMTVLGDEGNKPQVYIPHEMQQGSITRLIGGTTVKLRFQSEPAYTIGGGGQDVVMRVLPMSTQLGKASIKDLGYTQDHVDILEVAKFAPLGATIFSGVTGSGKTTTLEAMVRGIVDETHGRKKIFTVEDPNEYLILGATQIPVPKGMKGAEGNPFADAMRAAMRSDPDYIMVGEVRDEDSAQLLQRMILSGHAVLSTVHTSSAIKILFRFLDLGINKLSMCAPDFWNALVYQKLVQVLCPSCSIPWKEHPSFEDAAMKSRLLKITNNEIDGFRSRGAGCPHCKNRGIVGRTVVAEVIFPTYKMLDLFREEREADLVRYWRGDTGIEKTALGHAVSKVKEGIVDPMEFEEAFGKGTYLRELDV